MNKVILMGRLTRDPEVRWTAQTSGDPFAVARYTLAVNKKYKRESEPDADFINCVAFGKVGEFAEKYLKKGMLIAITGSIRVSSWEDQSGQKRWSTDVVVDEHYFAESKAAFEASRAQKSSMPYEQPPINDGFKPEQTEPTSSGFTPITESIEDDLPF